MADKRRRRTSGPLRVDGGRFAAGWRLLLDPDVTEDQRPEDGPRGAGITVDVVRPADLVALSFTAEGCELVPDDPMPVLRPRQGARARLTVTLAYQHLAEQAVYEGLAPKPPTFPTGNDVIADPADDPDDPVDGESARITPPIKVRPARASRLVFDVPAGERIPFSTAGLLDALGRLQLVVHPLATPAPGVAVAPTSGAGAVLHLPGNLVAVVTDGGTVVSRATGELKPPNEGDVERLLTTARNLRRARAALATTTGTVVGRNVALGALTGVVAPSAPPRPRPAPRPVFSRPPEEGETALGGC